MTISTQCPQCETRFKVSQAQLDAHDGLVRCGRCQAVFDATAQLRNENQGELVFASPPPLNGARKSASTAKSASTPKPVPTPKPASTPKPAPAAKPVPVAKPASADNSPPANTSEPASKPAPAPKSAPVPKPIPAPQPAAVAQPASIPRNVPLDIPDLTFYDEDTPEPPPSKKIWPWAVGCALLLLLLLAQAAYFYRVEIAARQPKLKPALMAYCQLLGCTVPLPRQTDLVSIESSNLEADPTHPNFITLEVLLRNHAPYALAWPDLELTLTNTQNKPVARRAFHPVEYLHGENDRDGLAAGREATVKLFLDTSDLNAAGFGLLLFYP